VVDAAGTTVAVASIYAFDLDGTLARCERWLGFHYIGEPIKPMVERAKELIAAGKEVIVITARLSPDHRDHERETFLAAWRVWSEFHFGWVVPVQAHKPSGLKVLYDDRVVAVETNTGRLLSPDVA
jgi:hypothetical protein